MIGTGEIKMPDTRFSLIGKACVWIVRATDAELRGMLAHGGWKGLKKVRSYATKKKRKGRFKKGSKEAKRYMAKIRRMR